MVRINLIEPSKLSDQHLIAEYREILLLFGYYRKHHFIRPSNDHKQPMRFYHNKILYLITRFFEIKEEMLKRQFKPIKDIKFCIHTMAKPRRNYFEPNEIQVLEIKQRILQRINERPTWYRYYGEHKSPEFFENLMQNHEVSQELNDLK